MITKRLLLALTAVLAGLLSAYLVWRAHGSTAMHPDPIPERSLSGPARPTSGPTSGPVPVSSIGSAAVDAKRLATAEAPGNPPAPTTPQIGNALEEARRGLSREEILARVEHERRLQLAAYEIAARRVGLSEEETARLLQLTTHHYDQVHDLYKDVVVPRTTERVTSDSNQEDSLGVGLAQAVLKLVGPDRIRSFTGEQIKASREVKRAERAMKNMVVPSPPQTE